MPSEISKIHIRDARPEDGIPVRRLIFDILCEYGVPADPDFSDADVMAFGKPSPGVIHLVALLGDKQVGSAILTPSENNAIKLSKLFLDKSCRGQGVGKKVLSAVVERARQNGYREVYLCTRALYKEAVRLYETSGWTRGEDQPPPGPDRLYSYTLE